MQIIEKPEHRNMQELEEAFQRVSVLEEPSERELDVSLKRPIKLNKSITPDISLEQSQRQQSQIEQDIWSANNIERFTRNLKIMKIGARDKYNLRKMSEFYTDIVEDKKSQCSKELRKLNLEFYGENELMHNQVHQYMSKENVAEMERRKEEVRWEFAWQIFDQVNERQELNN